ncbi:MAG TPA: methyl-accepting chemotaxis protein [Candidatus Eisenbacteria bacterium]|nr:methyl-accepting chemotaxis protein [Candidatus Eisenbacteria bacterium]
MSPDPTAGMKVPPLALPTPPRKAPARPNARASAPPFSISVFLTAAIAAAAAHWLPGALGLGAAAAVAVGGALVAGLLSRSSAPVAAPRAPSVPLEEFAREKERAQKATEQLEKTKRHAEIASTHLRDGKDPLTEVPELRVGPLHELLEAAHIGSTMPVMSRLTVSEDELVATDGEPLPVPWPKDAEVGPPDNPDNKEKKEAPADEPEEPGSRSQSSQSVEARAEMLRELNELIEGLDQLANSLSAPPGESGETTRTPAQLVDAVVHTAADGIEDLAAGLMRANELAGVAERVTNKATLLALNAALEATRSGSEAFAAIAEETRRLAEFAREATDTISRLSNEIEYKVTETITAIHATSEDAKSAVASFQSAPGEEAGTRIETGTVQRLLRRAQQLKRRLVAEAA